MNISRKKIDSLILGAVLIALLIILAVSRQGEKETIASHVVINEVCSNNFSVICDNDRSYYDYVELYNPADTDTDFAMYLSDDRNDLHKYRVDENVPAGGYLLVWLSGREYSGYLHAGFGLSKDGEDIFLSDEDGNIIDSMRVPALEYDQTYSREMDGSSALVVATGTPMDSNSCARLLQTDFAKSPSFSLEDGFYPVGTTLKLSASPLEKIYYTLDGSVPDENSYVYDGSIVLKDASENDNYYVNLIMYPTYNPPSYKVDKCNVVRAIAVNRFTGKKSRVASHSYFCGFEEKEAYKDAGVISLILDPEDLEGFESGIFVLGRKYNDYKEMGGFLDLPDADVPISYVDSEGNGYYRYEYTNAYYSGRESEKKASMSVFDGDHNLSFTQDIGVRVAGESSRFLYQKSLNLYARDIYSGTDSFYRGFFSDNEKKVRLRRSDSRIWFQEPMLHKVLGELGFLYQDSQMQAVFINGEYWGVYNLRDQYDDNYFLSHLGLTLDYLWLIKNNEADYGGEEAEGSYSYLVDFITYADSSNQEIYDEICRMVDIDSLIDYFCALIYFDDEDIEPRHNQMLWRTSTDMGGGELDGRWRWLVYDLDVTCADPENNTFEFFRDAGDGLYLPGYLYANEEFRNKFHDRMLELMETTFSYENLKGYIDEYDSLYRQQNIASVRRFEGIDYTEADYEKDLELLKDFLKRRPEYVKEYLEQDMADYMR